MRLEDTIRQRLFRTSFTTQVIGRVNDGIIIECKGEIDKSIPLCIPSTAFTRSSLVYRSLYLTDAYEHCRSTPRALYNLMFSSYFYHYGIAKLNIKSNIYYYAPGVLFTEHLEPLFYFAYNICEGNLTPRLYITPKLLQDSTVSNKPMEKFFMSTIVPFLVEHDVRTGVGSAYRHVIIEIDNQIDNTFFRPVCNLISSTPINQMNDRLNAILADNADTISDFIDSFTT